MATLQHMSTAEDIVLANFKNGKLQINDKAGPSSNSPEFTYYKNVDTPDERLRKRRILVAKSQSLQYVGYNHGPEAPKANSACKYLVGVLDKKTNKMKVYDAQYYQLRPWLHNDMQPDQDETDQPTEQTYIEKQDALTEAFGSLRKRRAVDSRHKSKVSNEAIEKSAKVAVTIAKSQPTTPIKETMDSEGVLPCCDREATKVEDVYKLDDLVAPHLLEALKKVSGKFCNANIQRIQEWQKQKTYSSFVLDHLRTLANEPTDEKQKKAAILLYLHNLSIMYALKISDLNKKIPFEGDTPMSVKKHLLDSFTQSTLVGDGSRQKRCLPKRMKDKMISHALVLALILDDYKTKLSPLQSAFKVGVRILESHARALGCRVTSIAEVAEGGASLPSKSPTAQKVAELSLPLRITYTPKKKLGGKKR
ncbi:DNA-directed RNA polymerase I subunit RPA49-like [Amphiura filiformis]|uniref:DNA-directed RNA polymerase I subunit RPA49-like n=1 Tax=Amphiura filiformis TaxID=82378 RepID=UPI003B2257A7